MSFQKGIVLLLSVVFVAVSCSGCSMLRDVRNEAVARENTPTVAQEDLSLSKTKESDYGYQSLQSDFERNFYQQFGAQMMKDEPEPFTIDYYQDTSRLVAIAQMYCFDHPEVFWLDDRHTLSFVTDSETFMEVTIGCTLSGSALQNAREALEKAVQTALTGMPADANDFEKEKYINDYLVETVQYDDAAAASPEVAVGNEHNAYGALVDKKCVCDGFATAFMLLAERAGINSSIVFGTTPDADENEFHAWNCVNIEGDWYYLDITWNDASDDTVPAIGRYINFNITTEQALRERTLLPMQSESGDGSELHLNNYFVPECTATQYNYFEYNCYKLTSLDDYSLLEEGMVAAAQNEEPYYYFTVSEALDFQMVYDQLMGGDLATVMMAVNDSGECAPLEMNTYVYSDAGNRIIIIALTYQPSP